MIYVLDANVFIDAAKRYYAFDIAPGFWDSLALLAQIGSVRSIDRVYQEFFSCCLSINRSGRCDLTIWTSYAMGKSTRTVF